MYWRLVLSYLPHFAEYISFKVAQWTFRNDGYAFTEQDWMRLLKIGVLIIIIIFFPTFLNTFPRSAEGNPSPDKVRAFGVGG